MDKFCNEANYRFFNALANRARLAVIDALIDKPKTAAEVSEALSLELEASTHYLELMAGCMMLTVEGIGKEKRYSLNREILEPLDELLVRHMSKHCPALKRNTPENKLKEHRKRVISKKASLEV
ncbi:MAG TPA: hypothetical protein VMD05_06085 [Candidatus Nanoarchaeia archaeon]|nr:hypothetical protein [Candidatus Nanoarchaeia archaeon]